MGDEGIEVSAGEVQPGMLVREDGQKILKDLDKLADDSGGIDGVRWRGAGHAG
ncbi:MAG: hypothetical protein PHI71_06605 [Acidiphilium sp.]|nr:hypothetical protein [Acidiphilium sp.]